MIDFKADTQRAMAEVHDAITTGSVGIPVELDLSDKYDGLAVTVCFEAGDAKADVAVLGGATTVEVPPQVLAVAGETLRIGVYASDSEGTVVRRTVWASAGTIRLGAAPSGIDPVGPAPSWAAQVQQAAAEAVETANSVRADADAGAFDGEDGYSPTATVEQLADGATISITDKDGTTTATIHDGADGATGPEGPAGYSPSATVTQTASGATITVTDQSGTTTADISNGAPGEPGQTGPIGPTGDDGFSPTVDVQPITGGHEVTITDADGPHSFDVMDGDPAEPGSITDEMLAPDGIKSQVAQLWGNQLTGTLSGTIDTAADAYAAPPMALAVEGKSTQAATTGKNLLSDDMADWPTRGISGANRPTLLIPVESGATYTYSRNVTGSLGLIAYWYNEETEEKADAGTSPTWTNYTGQTITNSGGWTHLSIACTSVSTELLRLRKAQLEKASTATAYEPYSGGKSSPSPDWPQPILSVDGLALVMAGGPDQLDKSQFGIGEVTNGYTRGSMTSRISCVHVTSLEKGKQYSIYRDTQEGATYTYEFNFMAYASGGITALLNTGWITEYPYTVTVPDTTAMCCFAIRRSNNSSGMTMAEFDVAGFTFCAPPLTTIPDLLPDGTLRSLPDGTRDTLSLSYLRPSTREGWAWYSRELVQRVYELEVDPTWSFSQSAAGGSSDRFNLSRTSKWPECRANVGLFNRFQYSDLNSNVWGYASIRNTNWLVFNNGDQHFSDVTAFKAWLTENPVTVTYPLTTPVTTQLDPIELPVLPAPNATVWCDGGSATPTYSMEYVQDTNLVVQQLTAETAIAYASIAAQDGPTATASHAIGTYLTMGGTLYKVTRAIAVGETIAAGTNVTATNVMAELLARTA